MKAFAVCARRGDAQETYMDKQAVSEFRKNIDFIDLIFRMSCASTRMAFGAGLEMLPNLNERDKLDADLEEGRYRFRAAIVPQMGEFEKLLELVGE